LKQVSFAIAIVLALQPSHFSAFGRCPFNLSAVRSAEKKVQMWAWVKGLAHSHEATYTLL
jgi:hypothetical protein